MARYADLALPEDGKLSRNILWFARALRKAGLPIGPGRVIDAIRAVEAVGFTERRDFYWTLHACFVSRPEHRAVFQQVFRLYWRDPRYMEQMMSLMLPAIRGVQEERRAEAAEKRAAEALLDGVDRDLPELPSPEGEEQVEIDASATMARVERLRTLDFEQMSVAEIAEAKRMLARLSLPVKPLQSRRQVVSALGPRIDARATLRAAMRQGGKSPGWSAANRRCAGPIWWCCAIYPGRCRNIAGWCCISCTRSPIARGRAGRGCMASPSAPG